MGLRGYRRWRVRGYRRTPEKKAVRRLISWKITRVSPCDPLVYTENSAGRFVLPLQRIGARLSAAGAAPSGSCSARGVIWEENEERQLQGGSGARGSEGTRPRERQARGVSLLPARGGRRPGVTKNTDTDR